MEAMMSDIVERLRTRQAEWCENMTVAPADHEALEAADEIERLRKQVAQAAKVMKPFAEMRELYGANERETVACKTLSNRNEKFLEVRHLTAAKEWMEAGNE
jgi:hypothetical protein